MGNAVSSSVLTMVKSNKENSLQARCCEPHKIGMSNLLDHAEFRKHGCQMVNLVVDYWENIGRRNVLSKVKPGYLASLIPQEAPEDPEPWEMIMEDIERVIMPGVTHWQHPNFHAYFPTAASYPSMCAEILANGFACMGFSWAANPACTELEVVMMDWLAKMLHLPEEFLSGGNGGGVIQGSCSEATLVALFGARNRTIEKYQKEHPGAMIYEAASKLVGYYSDQAHSSVERAGLISMIRLRKLRTGISRELCATDLEEAIKEDIANGLLPFFCVTTLGTTGCCAFDNLKEIGPVCEQYDIWLHVDAAYAGAAFICPEFRPLLEGIEHVHLARHFEQLLLSDQRFEIVYKVTLGLVCFRIKNNNKLTQKLYEDIEADGRIHLVSSEFHHPEEIYFIRFVICYPGAEEVHNIYAFQVIKELTERLLPRQEGTHQDHPKIEQAQETVIPR
ncbi:aromatic-L-amino-acid decarboxylase [Clonorchis sinensis]|uniref:Aromatic-L-amino-acid decarboxylase n=1 Tax=Clonorchis sinensis TaxID=79923 RepID=G7YCV1_CLOSI|nr:aromatic-L-amino-acid decarboxylase [Clonorchis sinensis]